MFNKISITKKNANMLMAFLFLVFSPFFVLGFYGNDKVIVDQILLEQELQEQKLDLIQNNEIIEGQSIMNLLSAIETKSAVANEKESAYEKAINELKWWVAGIGSFAIVILTLLGLWHNKELKTKKEELQQEFDKSINLMIKANEVNVKGVLIDLKQGNEKYLKLMREDINKQLAVVTEAVNKDSGTAIIVPDSENEYLEDEVEPTFE